MKKILLFMFLAVVAVGASAQTESISSVKNINAANALCLFKFDDNGIHSEQDSSKDYVVYEVPGVTASDLKSYAMSAISELYKSPKDVLTTLGDNMIQLETYASHVFFTGGGGDTYPHDISYSIIIQFKDGKVRYNAPNIKQIYADTFIGSLKLDMTKPITTLIEGKNRGLVALEFNGLIKEINNKISTSNDW